MFTCFGLVHLFVVDLFVCLFCYCSLPVTALPNYVITLLYLPLVRLFVFVLFFEFVDVFVSRFGRVVALFCYSLVCLFLCCLSNLVFLGDLGRSFVDLRSVSSRGVFLAGYGVPLLCVLRTCLSRTSALAAVRFVCCLTLGVGADLVSVGGGGRERKRG